MQGTICGLANSGWAIAPPAPVTMGLGIADLKYDYENVMMIICYTFFVVPFFFPTQVLTDMLVILNAGIH